MESDDWSTFAHDQQRTGMEQQPIGITASSVSRLSLQWTYQSSGSIEASPILVSGVLYVVDVKGLVSALRAADGTIIWTKQLPTATSFVMTPALHDGTLFLASHNDGP